MTRASLDVLVIGGGVIGASIALACADRGLRTALWGGTAPPASAAAAGMLCPSFEAMHEGGDALVRLGCEALSLWDDFAARIAGSPKDIDYRRGGALGVGFPPGLLRGVPVPVPRGVEAQGGVMVEGEGQVDPRSVLVALRVRLAEAGVRRIGGNALRLLTEGDRVVGAEGDEGGGAVLANRCVLATGMGGLAPPGLLRGVRGRAFRVRPPEGFALPGAGVLRSPAVYLCEKADGTLYVGATEEERQADAMLDGLWHEASWLVPALRGAERLGTYDGIRPRTEDGLPVIGPDPDRKNLFLALGHHRNGVLLAPLTARRAATWCAA